MSKRPTKRPGRPSKQPPKRFRDEEAEGEDEMGVKESLTQLLAEQKALRKEIAEIRAAKTPAPEASPAGSTTSTGGKSNSGMAGHSGHSGEQSNTGGTQAWATGNQKMLPIDLHVPKTIKEKIWSGVAVRFAILLPADPKEMLEEDSDEDDEDKKKKKKKKEKKLLTFTEWVKAWNIYTTILQDRAKEVHRGLGAHFARVCTLHELQGNWRDYDYRYRLAIAAGERAWGDSDADLFATTRLEPATQTHDGGKKKPQGGAGGKTGSGNPAKVGGFCFQFNEQGSCSRPNCGFKHFCSQCGGQHAIRKCSAKGHPFRAGRGGKEAGEGKK
ncbi:hypothetical protein V1264_016017 [Littorina saxatilis]|uniref:C3H1-type domain-containing protein n=1 Tax=Littorina saxatilis TaxID=31220 RepID=A0AAN9BN99_9CAEN